MDFNCLSEMDFIPWAFTFIVSLFVGLEYGMMVGFVISVIYLMYYAARPGVKVRRGYVRNFYLIYLLYAFVEFYFKDYFL